MGQMLLRSTTIHGSNMIFVLRYLAVALCLTTSLSANFDDGVFGVSTFGSDELDEPELQVSESILIFQVQTESTSQLINSGGGEVQLCELSTGTLPDGLAVEPSSDSQTCEIIGSPTTLSPVTSLEITGHNNAGPSDLDISIQVNPSGSDWSDLDLTGFDLSEQDLSNINLSGSNLSGVDLSTTTLTGARYDEETIFESSFDPVAAGMTTQSTQPATTQVPHPLWLYGVLIAGLGILGVRGISRSRA